MKLLVAINLVLLIVTVTPATVFTENLESGWANGSGGNLGGTGAQLNNWVIRNPAYYSISTESSNRSMQRGSMTNYTSTIAGKGHGLDVSGNTAIEISFRMSAKGAWSSGYIWLSDANQNGYGINTIRFNYNQACICKWSGGNVPFGGATSATLQTDNPVQATTVSVGIQNNDWITYHLRIEQASPGNPVKLTMWVTDTNYYGLSGSYIYWQQMKTDTGADTGAFTGPITDIRNLKYIAFTACPDLNSDSAGYVKIDDLIIDNSVSMTIPMLDGVVTVKAAAPYNAMSGDDMVRLRRFYDSADAGAGPGIDDDEWTSLNQLCTIRGFRSANITRDSYQNGDAFMPGSLAGMLWSAQRRHLNPHIVVGACAPAPAGYLDPQPPHTEFPANAANWSSTDWNNYADHAYKLIKYVVTFQGDVNWPAGFDEVSFEVENEPEGPSGGTATSWWYIGAYPQSYEPAYQALYQIWKVWSTAAQRVADENPGKTIKMGGFGGAYTWLQWLPADAASDHQRLDFLGYHSYSNTVGKRDPANTQTLYVQSLRQALDNAGYPNAQIRCTEWGPDAWGSTRNSNAFGAAWTAGCISEWLDYLDDADSLLFYQPDTTWLWPGHVTNDAKYPTAQGNVFRLYSMLPGHRVAVSESNLPFGLQGAVASTDGNTVGVAIYNYVGLQWATSANLSQAESVQIVVNNLPFLASSATVQRFVVDANHSNIYNQYVLTGIDVDPNKVTLQQVEQFSVQVSGGMATLPRTTMPQDQVSLWLVSADDTTVPSPNPMTWAASPTAANQVSITMSATAATDTLFGVEYYFECLTAGGHNSGWQASPIYIDAGLKPNTSYSYHVKARDTSANHNATGFSSTLSATTKMTSPWPNPAVWSVKPHAANTASITMIAVPAHNPYFLEAFESLLWANNSSDNLGLGGGNNGWLCRGAMGSYSLAVENSNHYLNLPIVTPLTWITVGKPHGLDTRGVTALELSFRARNAGTSTQPVVWLSDRYQNGYGIYMLYNTAAIIKYNGCTVPYASITFTQASGGLTNWTSPQTGEDSTHSVSVGSNFNGWITIHLRLEQVAPGQPMKMMLWQTGSNIADRSYISPAQVKTDNGTGTGVFSQGLFDISNLTWVGLSSGYAGSGSAQLDDIRVELLDVALDPTPAQIQYQFECVSGGGHTSAWQDSPIYTDTGLSPNTQYSYKMRVKNITRNPPTVYSSTESVMTLCTGDFDSISGVNFADFAEFANHWLESGSLNADFDGSGSVDLLDLRTFGSNWLCGSP